MRALSGSKNVSSPAGLPEAAAASRASNRAETAVAALAVMGYIALQIILALQHEPWVDEAQAWLQARTISNATDFLVIPGEGHPPLWYWLLRVVSLGGLDFNQARTLPVLVAATNAVLLARLLRGHLLALVTMLFSFSLLQFWGYHFRPYSMVFGCLVGALLLDRANRPVAASWLMAISCGFHFFSGFLFALWLVAQWQRDARLRHLAGPAALALLFGGLAVLSGLGNQTAGIAEAGLVAGAIRNLAWVGMIDLLRTPIVALLTALILIYALRKNPLLLATLLLLLLVFSIGTAAVYGKYPWHTAFMTMMCFTAMVLTGLDNRKELVLAVILVPQVVFGLASVANRLTYPTLQQPDLYEVVAKDAGADFVPAEDLVVWPDLAGLALTATYDVTAIDGNNGGPTGPIAWRTRQENRIDPILADKPGPYWLVCANCEMVLDFLAQYGRSARLLAGKPNFDNGDFYAYRID